MTPEDHRSPIRRRRWSTQLELKKMEEESLRWHTRPGLSSTSMVSAGSVELISVGPITYLVVNAIRSGPIIFPLSPAQLQKFKELSRDDLRSTPCGTYSILQTTPLTRRLIPPPTP